MWNPLPKLGLMLFTLEDTPNLALLKLEFERQAMGSVNIHFASNLFCWGRLVSILEKKKITREKCLGRNPLPKLGLILFILKNARKIPFSHCGHKEYVNDSAEISEFFFSLYFCILHEFYFGHFENPKTAILLFDHFSRSECCTFCKFFLTFLSVKFNKNQYEKRPKLLK